MFGQCRGTVEAGVTTGLAIGANHRDLFWISSLHLRKHFDAGGQDVNERCLSRCFRFLHERIQNRKHEIAGRRIGPKIYPRSRAEIVDLPASSSVKDFQPEPPMEQNCGVGKAQRWRLVAVEPKIVLSQALNKFWIE